MDKAEVANLLVMVSALDRQPVDEGMVEMWHRVLGDYTFEECERALVPAYKDSKSGFLTAKAIYDQVRVSESGPGYRVWVKNLHNIGEHFECRPGEFGCR
jgi:hypothetical protein